MTINKKLSPFVSFLGGDPVYFSEGEYVISAEVSKEEFIKLMLECRDEERTIEDIKEDWVHFHINLADDDFGNRPAWWLSSKRIKGAKKVWVC